MIGKIAHILSKLKASDEGVTAVEFALVLPIYLASLLSVMEISRMVYTKAAVMHAAEEATRYAMVNYGATTTELETKATAGLVGLSADNLLAVVITNPVDPTDQTRLVSIQINYQYVPILPIGYFLGGDETGFEITGESKGFLTEEIPAL